MTATDDRPAARSIAAVMADPNWEPTRDQVADLIAMALTLGDTDLAYAAGWDDCYRAALTAELAAWPPPPHGLRTTAREDARHVYRLRCARNDWHPPMAVPAGTYPGGEMPVWDPTRPDMKPPAVSVTVRRVRGGLVWADPLPTAERRN